MATRRRDDGDGDGALVRARVSLRIDFADASRLGPGKIALLEAIGRTGSISAAGRALGMSYRRAWLLVDALNAMFSTPVVAAAAGGARGGGAELTPLGQRVVDAYRRLEAAGAEAMRAEFAGLAAHLRAAGTDDAIKGP